jgi:tetratricopeptide (TPR) repeat protein
MNYGMLLVLMGSLHEAEAPLKESERLFGGAAHVGSYERAWPLISFGDIALRRGIYNEAERCYRQAATIWGGDLFGMAVCHGSLAELAVARGRWDDALELAEQSLQGRVESEDKFGIGWTLKVKGCALLGKGLMVEAIESFLEGQLYMQQYGSQFGDSELAVSICEAYARNHLFREFETSAQKLEQLANNGVRDRYHNHLARMGVLRGLVELYRRLDSSRTVDDEDWVRNVSSLFVNGLIEALQHNIFLLDSLIDMIQAAFVRNRWPLPFQRHICELICSLWQSSSIEGESVVSVERRSRIQQDIDGTHRGMLFDSLRNDRPALLLTID